jgi:hypothetical protein
MAVAGQEALRAADETEQAVAANMGEQHEFLVREEKEDRLWEP